MKTRKKNNPVIIMLMMLLGMYSLPAMAQTRHLSLQEAVMMGLENSKKLKASRAEIEQAQAQLAEMRNNRLPDIKVQGAYMRLNQPTVDLKIPMGSGSDTSGGSAASSIKVNQLMYGMANASLPLFAGFRIKNAIESSKLLLKATELDADKDRDEVIQNIIAAYYSLYKANAAVDLVIENQKQAASRVNDLKNLEQNGLLARNDLLKAELQQSNVELALVDATNDRNIAQFNLNLMLGLDASAVLELDHVSEQPAMVKTLQEWQQTALENRADYQSLSYRKQAAGSGVKAAKGDYFPSLALTGGYVAGYIPDVLTVSNALNVGVGVSYNIASLYKTKAKVNEAKARENQIYWTSEQLNDGIRTQIYQAYENYKEALQKITVYEKAVEQASENYRITKNKFDNALETTTNLLDADVAQLQAKLNYEFAKVDAVIAYNKLFETAGVISQINK